MNGKDDVSIAKKMGISVLDLHEILSKFEKLDAKVFSHCPSLHA